jgi:hypothetical protein
MSMRFEYGRKPEPKKISSNSGAGLLQRKVSRFPRSDETTARKGPIPHGDFTAIPAVDPLGQWLSSAPGNVADTPVHYPSPLADRYHVRALTTEDGIHVAAQSAQLPGPDLDALLAHEAAHVSQQTAVHQSKETPELEYVAHALAPEILAGRAVHPRTGPVAGVVLTDTPPDRAAVEAAKKRLTLLNKFVDEWGGREARRLEAGKDRDPLLQKRTKMDDDPTNLREKMEAGFIANLNRAPLDIRITDDEVLFHVRFQVRFEDPAMSKRFDELKGNLEKGITTGWNQTLKGVLFGGRKFVLEPEVQQVSATAARDRKFWLITVRPDDNAPVSYPSCKLPQPPPGVPTSVTDSTCDGGVMSIPPAHISDPFTYGHEVLHLFGLVDRYAMLTHTAPGKKPITTIVTMRETEKRPDPLGNEPGTILSEDLTFLFDRLGVYTMEESRGLDTLRKLEDEGLGLNGVLAEIRRQQEIINRGGSRPTLFKRRTDFNDKIIKDSENL